jgi:Plasmid pRiA4b ORF-3-like protein
MMKMEPGDYGWPGDYMPFDDTMNIHETVVQVSGFLRKAGDTILYVYDKYMDWYHLITLEDILTEYISDLDWQPSAGMKGFAFQLLEAEKACPPEDCGGKLVG